MTLFERRLVVGMLFGILAQTSDNPIAGVVMASIGICYLVAAIFTKDGAGNG